MLTDSNTPYIFRKNEISTLDIIKEFSYIILLREGIGDKIFENFMYENNLILLPYLIDKLSRYRILGCKLH